MKIKNLMIAALAVATLSACVKDDNAPDSGTATKGELVDVTFTITQKGTATRSAEDNYEAATDAESKVTNVTIYVFDADGYFETSKNFTLAELTAAATNPTTGNVEVRDTYTTKDVIGVAAGKKYFYALANMDVITGLEVTTKVAFEKMAQTANTATIIGGANADGFYMGTRFTPAAVEVEVAKDYSGVNAIPLNIGRMAAKVNVYVPTDVTVTVAEGLKALGAFTLTGTNAMKYRLNNIPDKWYLIGQWSGTPLTAGAQALAYYYNSYAGDYTGAIGLEYTQRADGTTDYSNATWTAGNMPSYTVENTCEVPRWGTATTVSIGIPFVPLAGKIIDPATGSTGTLTDGTFWRAVDKDGNIVIYNADPASVAGLSLTNIVKHTNGICYYTVAVADTKEDAPSARYSVIRNHSYQLKITSIKGFGSNTPIVDDKKEDDPIGDTADLIFELDVLNWSSVPVQEVGL